MPSVITEAVVLRTYKLAEADKIVVLMTHAAGLVRGVARGARRIKSRFGASLEPWTVCEVSYFEKEGRELVTLKSVEITRSCFGTSGNTELVHALDYMSELTLEFMPPHEPNAHMFRMIKAAAEAAQIPEAKIKDLVQYFEIWTLRLSGFLPSFRQCMSCRQALHNDREVFLNMDGAIHCEVCAKGVGIPLSAEAIMKILSIQSLSPQEYMRSSNSTNDNHTSEKEVHQLLQRLITRALEREPRGRIARA